MRNMSTTSPTYISVSGSRLRKAFLSAGSSASIGSSSLPASASALSAGSVAASVSSCVSSSLRVGLDGASASETVSTSVRTLFAGLACTFRRSTGSSRVAFAMKRTSFDDTYFSTSTRAPLSSAAQG